METISITIPILDIVTIENNPLSRVKPPMNVSDKNINKAILILVKGWHNLNRCTKPINPVDITHIEETSSCDRLNTKFPKILIAVTVKTISKAVGIALLKTYFKKESSTRLLLGSRASMNDGIPIHIPLIKVNCIGINGYSSDMNINITSNSIEYIVLIKNRDADLFRLFIERLPSATTFGSDEKSESNSTNCDIFLVASAPFEIAILQSDSLRAGTSLTPSPVIATI